MNKYPKTIEGIIVNNEFEEQTLRKQLAEENIKKRLDKKEEEKRIVLKKKEKEKKEQKSEYNRKKNLKRITRVTDFIMLIFFASFLYYLGGQIAEIVNLKEKEMNKAESEEFYNTGLEKHQNGDYEGAIADLTKAIELNPDYADFYHNRGVAKHSLSDNGGACEDWKIAASMGHTQAKESVAIFCN